MAGRNAIIAGIESHLTLDDGKWLAALKRSSAATKAFAASTSTYGKTAQNDMAAATKSASGLSSAMMGLAASAISVATAQKLFSVAKMGAQLEDAKTVFKAAGNSLDEFRAKTKGLLSDQMLVQKFNFAKQMGISKDAFFELAKASDAAAKKMGISQEYAFDSLITGTARGSKPILDNVGILYEAEKAYETYAKSIGKTVDKLTDQEKQTAKLNEVMRQARAMTEEVSGINATMSDSFDQIDAAVSNLTTGFGKFLMLLGGDTLASGSSMLAKFANELDAVYNAMEKHKNNSKGGLLDDEETKNSLRAAQLSMADFWLSAPLNPFNIGGVGRSAIDKEMASMGAGGAEFDMNSKQWMSKSTFDETESRILKLSEDLKMLREEQAVLTTQMLIDPENAEDAAFGVEKVTKAIADTTAEMDRLKAAANFGDVSTPVEAEMKARADAYKADFDLRSDSEERVAELRAKKLKEAEAHEKRVIELRKQAERDIKEIRDGLKLANASPEKRTGLEFMQGLQNLQGSEMYRSATKAQQSDLLQGQATLGMTEFLNGLMEATTNTEEMAAAANNFVEALPEDMRAQFADLFIAAAQQHGISGNTGFDPEAIEQGYIQGEKKLNDERAQLQALWEEAGHEIDDFNIAVNKLVEVMDASDAARIKAAANGISGPRIPINPGLASPFNNVTVPDAQAEAKAQGLADLKALPGDLMSGKAGGIGLSTVTGMVGMAIGGPAGAEIGAAIGEAAEQMAAVLTGALLDVAGKMFSDERLQSVVSVFSDAAGPMAAAAALAGVGVGLPLAALIGAATVSQAAFSLSTQGTAYTTNDKGEEVKGSDRTAYQSVQDAIAYTLDPLIRTLGQIWEYADPLIGLFMSIIDVLQPLAGVFVAVFGPTIMQTMFDGIKLMALAIGYVALGLQMLAGTILSVQGFFLEIVGSDEAKEKNAAAQAAVRVGNAELATALENLAGLTYEEAAERGASQRAIVDEIEAREEATDSQEIYNGAVGFKLNSYDFGASEGRNGRGGSDGNDAAGVAGGRFDIGQLVILAPRDESASAIAEAITNGSLRAKNQQFGNPYISANVRARVDAIRR